ncbi:chorismate--pyruvate lyase family protein [Xylophilus ampelinus]|uniref:Chorismate lyase n=1 Tax=Xylophilus ampelinus TaxID=54067 RepID=A0A318SD11_9BURK|nr:chorismate lyase [Xylophilus ampelinus]MCS4511346.1 chorismate lyase [Xylophilus ampelinus]PYE74898.1 chorismate lyase [Xylophilus ampelinus]
MRSRMPLPALPPPARTPGTPTHAVRHAGLPQPASGRRAAWLRTGGSLSARLAAAGGSVSVQVLRQGRLRLLPAEAAWLGGPRRRYGHVREVLLSAGAMPVVFARSVLRQPHARGSWKAVRGLGGRALADLLFGRPAARRSGFAFVRFAPASRVAAGVRRRWQQATGQAWGSRSVLARVSVFARRGAPLLLTECLAPAVGRLGLQPRARPVRWRPKGGESGLKG